MAVFGELNRQPRRLEDPEARKSESIKKETPKSKKKGKSRSSVSVKTYRRSIVAVNIIIGVAAAAAVIYFASLAISSFLEQ